MNKDSIQKTEFDLIRKHIDDLAFENEFILHLVNNNYSEHTVNNYQRDLDIFKIFLWSKEYKFENIDKLKIDEYKGYLRQGIHLLDIDKLLEIDKNNQNPTEIDANAEPEVEYKKSSSMGSRNGKSIDSGLNSRSINRMLSALRSFLAFLIDYDKNSPLSPTAIKFIKTEKTEKQVADFEEIVELIEAPENYETKRNVKFRNRAILELLFSTGMRISEVIKLNRKHLKIGADGFTVSDPKLYIMGKGKKQRYVYLTSRCTYYLSRYLEVRKDDYPALFIPYRGQRKGTAEPAMVRLSSRYVQNVIKRYKELLGILVPTTPHSLRHGFATYLAEQGANPAAIQRLLGHESLQTTTRYVHASDRFAQNTHKNYHPLKEIEDSP